MKNKTSISFFLISAIAFIMTCLFGEVASIKVAFPSISHSILPFEKLRPLHTLFAISGVLSGIMGWISYTGNQNTRYLRAFSLILFLLFLFGSVFSLSTGIHSGREYFSWPPIFSIPLILSFTISLYLLFIRFQWFISRSPEGAWLIGFGAFFILIGMSESLAWLIPFIGFDFAKDLTLQWHGVDTFFAGIDAFLYGVGVIIVSKKSKPLRSFPLFIIAVFGLLFTFGHHHYLSPQPHFLKIIAFFASMIAMFSFLKHLRSFKNKLKRKAIPNKTVIMTLLGTVEIWTIVAFASGILFAIPKVNLLVHGTYLILIHAMGSMIGVQLALVFAGAFWAYKPLNLKSEKRIIRAVRLLNWSLFAMWLVMGTAGIIKGTMLSTSTFYEIEKAIRYYLYLLPVAGAVLFYPIYTLSYELIKSLIEASRSKTS